MWYIPKIVVLCTKLFNMHIAPHILWKEIEYQIWSSQACKGFMLPLPCSWCYEWYHIVILCWICIECMSSEPLWKMYLHGNKHFEFWIWRTTVHTGRKTPVEHPVMILFCQTSLCPFVKRDVWTNNCHGGDLFSVLYLTKLMKEMLVNEIKEMCCLNIRQKS